MYEIDRIVGLPIIPPMTKEEEEEFNRQHLYLEAYKKGFRFFSPQANAIKAYLDYQGAFLPIGVGCGKTLVSLMIANLAYRNKIDKIFLCVPSQVTEQLERRDIPWARRHVPLSVPIYSFVGLNQPKRNKLVLENQCGMYIIPYSYLSTTDAKNILYGLNPDLIIADECHYLKNHDSARTRRLFHFIKSKERTIKFVALSGTITNKSIMEYWWLTVASLRWNCPLPLVYQDVILWANILDTEGISSDFWRFKALQNWAKINFPEKNFPALDQKTCRLLYRQRLRTCPGVVFNVDTQLGCSLLIVNEKPKEPGKELKDLVDNLTGNWVNPEGENLAFAVQVAQYMHELSAGFYHKRVWPKEVESGLLKQSIKRWELRKEFNREVASYIRAGNRDYDTPFLFSRAMREGDKGIPKYIVDIYNEYKKIEKFINRISGEPVRVDDFKIVQALEWAKKNRDGIIWYYHRAVGKWLKEALDSVAYFAEDHPEEFVSYSRKDKCFIASWAQHGTGKNLQYAFDKNFFVQWPVAAQKAEQVIGRTHRQGQESDEVLVYTNHFFDYDYFRFAAALNNAAYIELTTGERHKILYAEYSPLPLVYKSRALHAHGFSVKEIDYEELKQRLANGKEKSV